jgi:hypothetical protein
MEDQEGDKELPVLQECIRAIHSLLLCLVSHAKQLASLPGVKKQRPPGVCVMFLKTCRL